nr:armadillo-type fold [Tanacetum cinerariifolium]
MYPEQHQASPGRSPNEATMIIMEVEYVLHPKNELEQQLIKVGQKLSQPPLLIHELLLLLNQAEKVLSLVEQTLTFSMQDALKPLMKALIHDDLLRHSDVDVKVAVASCIAEIIRITAPDPPYDDDRMRAAFQLIVSSFADLADRSSLSYIKRTLILEAVCKVRSSVIMLDLECDALIVEMFEHFLRSIRVRKEALMSFLSEDGMDLRPLTI